MAVFGWKWLDFDRKWLDFTRKSWSSEEETSQNFNFEKFSLKT